MGGPVMQLAVAPDGRSVAVAVMPKAEGETARVELRRRDGSSVPGWPKLGSGAEGVAFSPDGRLLAAAFRHWGRVQVWDVESRGQLAVEGAEDIPNAYVVAFSADGSWLAAGSYSHDGIRLHFWQADGRGGWRRRHELTAPEREVWGFAFAPSGTLLAAGIGDGRDHEARAAVHIIDAATGKPVPGPAVKPARAWAGPAVAFAAGQPLLAVSWLGEVRVFSVPGWDPRGGPIPVVKDGAKKDLTALAVSADGRWLAGGRDEEVLLWRVADGAPVETLSRHTDQVTSLAFSPDGRTLLSGAKDGVVWVHDLAEVTR
jgi:WD40 repeat protein